MIVTDENVEELAKRKLASLQAAGFQTKLTVLPPGEVQKSLAVASSLYDWLAENQADRRHAILRRISLTDTVMKFGKQPPRIRLGMEK